MNATRTVSILLADLMADGLVKSLSQPGGNDVAGKSLVLLREAILGLSRVATMLDVGFIRRETDLKQNQVAARELRLNVLPLKVEDPEAFESAFARAGGLMRYCASIPESWYGAATYAHMILREAKRADLPVRQAKDFEFILNRSNADALGLALPAALLLQVGEVVR